MFSSVPGTKIGTQKAVAIVNYLCISGCFILFQNLCLCINHSTVKNALSHLHFIIQDLAQIFSLLWCFPQAHSIAAPFPYPAMYCPSDENFCGIWASFYYSLLYGVLIVGLLQLSLMLWAPWGRVMSHASLTFQHYCPESAGTE